LISARDGLIRDKIALQNQAKNLTLPLLKRQHKRCLDRIERHIEQIDAEVATIIAADPKLARRREIISSIAGVGTRTADQLVATMPELGALDPKQAASLAGLAPVARQSGQWKGCSFIQGRRANVRRAHYMPALVAARYNPDLKAKYNSLIASGKPAKVAVVTLMRKLIVMANALIKADRLWVERRA
jgi:transposase